MAMSWYYYPRSHIQFLVPLHYKHGGSMDSTDNSAAWDGNPDTELVASGTDSTRWTYADSPTAKWLYIWGHSGNMTGAGITGQYTIETVSGSIDRITQWEEKRGQGTADWLSWSAFFARNNADAVMSNLLWELDNSTAFNWYEFIINSVAVDPTIRGVFLSENFKVPMYGHSWTATYEFGGAEEEDNPAGVVLTNFQLAANKKVKITHSFEWTGLTYADLMVFRDFALAFAGQIAQPFVMCIINGSTYPATNIPTMESRVLIIENGTITEGRDTNGDYKVSFSAVELRYDF